MDDSTKLSTWHNLLDTTTDLDDPVYSSALSTDLNKPAMSGTRNSIEFLPKSTSRNSRLTTVAIFDAKGTNLWSY